MELKIDNNTARKFILLKHGLYDKYKFVGKEGIMDYIRTVGSIQFDPIDICGKNPELVLQSRIEYFTKDMLYELLYQDRILIDYFDKNLSIFPAEQWKYFSRMREAHRIYGRSREEVNKIENQVRQLIIEKGNICSKDLKLNKSTDWYWSKSSLARVALETMYFQGDLVIHHKKGALKYYALTEKIFPLLEKEDPNKNEYDYKKWLVLRRIGAVGLLWNRSSDAFLGIGGWMGIKRLSTEERNKIFFDLEKENKIIPLKIKDCKDIFYIQSQDKIILQQAINNDDYIKRTEVIAPLDNLLWDRKLIKQIFNFDYKWEIYTPPDKRKFGYYVLPLLSGLNFIGRIELINDKKNKILFVKNLFLEEGQKIQSGQIDDCIKRFAKFNNCQKIVIENSLNDFFYEN